MSSCCRSSSTCEGVAVASSVLCTWLGRFCHILRISVIASDSDGSVCTFDIHADRVIMFASQVLKASLSQHCSMCPVDSPICLQRGQLLDHLCCLFVITNPTGSVLLNTFVTKICILGGSSDRARSKAVQLICSKSSCLIIAFFTMYWRRLDVVMAL